MQLIGLLARAFVIIAVAALLATVASGATAGDTVQSARLLVVVGRCRVAREQGAHFESVSNDAASGEQRATSPLRHGAEDELFVETTVLAHFANQVVAGGVEACGRGDFHCNDTHLVFHALNVESVAARGEEGGLQLTVVAPEDDRLAVVHGNSLLVLGR